MNEAGNKRSLRRRPLIEEIEPRILYSSDAGPLTAMAIIAEHRSVDSAGEFVSQASAQVSPAAPAQARHEIVFVETNTPHYQQLIEGIKSQSAEQRQIDVVLLDPQADGINQISAALAGQTDVTAVHLISHGADGQVRLGATTLNFDSLLKNATKIRAWGQSLSAGADLLIYGCDVARAADGKGLIDALSRLTGADVAASDDVTGAASLGGDWELEYQTGQIDTQLAVPYAGQLSWDYTLGVLANSAPDGTDKTISTPEDAQYTFSAADFGFTDPNDNPPNALSSVRMTTLPGAGNLTLAGVSVTAGQMIAVADVYSGKLQYNPPPNANGSNYASFTFQVQDDGGTANGGVDLDPTPNTITLNLIAVNDAPAGTDNAVTTKEDTQYAFTSADFGFTDPNDNPANSLAAVKISGVPGAGSLTLSGVAVSAGQTITLANIAAGNLKFTPVANTNGTGYAGFTFQVQDDGGTANGGIDLDASPNTMMINVTAVNDAPLLTGANNLASINENPASNPGTLVSALIAGHVSDVDTGAVSGIAVTAVDNSNGTWQYSTNGGGTWSNFGSPSELSARLLAADASTSVRFVPNLNWNGTVSNGLTFRSWDQTFGTVGATADTGFHSVLDSFGSFSYGNNDGSNNWSAPWVETDANGGGASGGSMKVNGPGMLWLKANDTGDAIYREADLSGASFASLSFSYNNHMNTSGSIALQISSNGGSSYTTLATFSKTSNSGAGTNSFDISSYISSTTRVRFYVTAPDGGGPLDLDDIQISYQTDNAAAFSTASANSGITVNAVNDAPAGTNNTVTTLEDTSYTFASADFGFTDPNDNPANNLAAVKISGVPGTGSLTLSGVAVTAGQTITLANIAAGNLKFTPAANANGTGYASFTFQVQDDGGTGNGGLNVDASPNTMTMNVTAVNDAPAGTNNTVTTLEDTSYTFASADFGFTDPNDNPANNLAAVKISGVPGAGSLTLSGVAVTAGQTITLANIAAGNVKFTPAANAHATGYASFTFQVQDDGGTANGGMNLEPAPHTISIDVALITPAAAQTPASSAPIPPMAPPSIPVLPRPSEATQALTVPADIPAATPIGSSLAQADSDALPGLSAHLSSEQPESSREEHRVPDGALTIGPTGTATRVAAVDTPGHHFAGSSERPNSARVRDQTAQLLTQSLTELADDVRYISFSDMNPEFGREPTQLSLSTDHATLGTAGWAGELNRMRETVNAPMEAHQRLVASSILVTGGMSVGYVVWLFRGGLLLGSLLSSLPAWQLIDPLPVLARSRRRISEDAVNWDPFEKFFNRAKAAVGVDQENAVKNRISGAMQAQHTGPQADLGGSVVMANAGT